MNLPEAVTVCIQDYYTFSGRARRSEYWWFILFVTVVSLILSAIDPVIFGRGMLLGLNGLFGLLTLVPQLAVSWRRMHDTGRPGWYVLLPAISAILLFVFALGNPNSALGPGLVIGLAAMALLFSIVILVWLAMPGQPGENRFGRAPPP